MLGSDGNKGVFCVSLLMIATPACRGAVSNAMPDATSTQPSDASIASASDVPDSGALRPWIDTHAHPVGLHTECTTKACADAVVDMLDRFAVRRTILIHPPAAGSTPKSGESNVRNTVALRPDRFFLGVGGCDLNSSIQATAGTSQVTNEVRDAFAAKTNDLLAGDGAVVVGETTALHLSYEPAHPFEEIAPNAQLFKDLADLVVTKDVAIDFHMDAVKQTMNTPSFYTQRSPNNPASIQGNIEAFSDLLAHNRKTRFVWAHVGRDTTGDMTPALVDSLLVANENLFIQVHAVFGPLQSSNAIVDESFAIRPEWLELLKKYPDRAVVGTDSFFTGTESDAKGLDGMQRFLQGLPADLANRIGCENPVRIYKLPSGC